MAILVTGGAGYIGSHMIWELLDHGEEVVVLDRLTTGHDWAVPMDARLVVGDVGDRVLIDTLFADYRFEAVIHFAALTVVPDSFSDPVSYYENNTAKALNLIRAATRHGTRHFIFSSTAAVYGVTGDRPTGEDAPLDPVSPYGMSKLMTERMLTDACAASGMTSAILRYFNVAGGDPRGRTGQSTPNATHLIKVACETAAGKRPALEIFGTDYDTRDGTCIRDFIHVSDLVDLHYRALTHLRGGSESFTANCGYGTGTTILEVVAGIERVTGRTMPVKFAPRRGGDVVVSIADATRIRQLLDWTPRYDTIDDIVATSIAWEEALKRRNTPMHTVPPLAPVDIPAIRRSVDQVDQDADHDTDHDSWDQAPRRPVPVAHTGN